MPLEPLKLAWVKGIGDCVIGQLAHFCQHITGLCMDLLTFFLFCSDCLYLDATGLYNGFMAGIFKYSK